MKWLSNKLDNISKLNYYVKPEEVKGSLKLDANENLVLNKKFSSEIVSQAIKNIDLRIYPLEQSEAILYRQLAKYTGIDEKYIAAGNGSDQIIELILSTVARGRRVTVFTPTFSYFINRCELHGLMPYRVSLEQENNSLPKSDFLNSARQTDIVYICSPNNPTGNQFGKQIMLELINILEDKLIIIDEAYVEFAEYSLAPAIYKYDNIIILRTLSKAFGLAGARVGYLIANERFAHIFRSRIQLPYALNTLSLNIASMALARSDYVKETIEAIKRERERMLKHLHKMDGIKAFKSNANFIFFQSYDKDYTIMEQLKKENLSVKALGSIGGRNGCFRVTVGTREMNDRFLRSLEIALESKNMYRHK
jgi:histidinol-phosphate aminotransferase